MQEFHDRSAAIQGRAEAAKTYLKIEALRTQRDDLAPQLADPDLWSDADRARKVTSEFNAVEGELRRYDDLIAAIEDVITLIELVEEDEDADDESTVVEIAEELARLETVLDEVEVQSLFSGEHDENDAICEVHSGAGGTDAQDWAEMLARMQQRWAQDNGYDVELVSLSQGQEAGITSATFMVRGRFAFGWLKSERGVHRLVRISPFDSNARRHTAFASMEVTPLLDDADLAVEIDEKDLRIDTYRSSGAGGQHVNVTDSAVRITHQPTGIVVSCQNERSQLQNKNQALQILAAKLAEKRRQEQAEKIAAISGQKADVAWGSQIRSYVLAPYQLVKDERTGHETGNVANVLDGQLRDFMEAYLRWRRIAG